jgi:hypothetical protein
MVKILILISLALYVVRIIPPSIEGFKAGQKEATTGEKTMPQYHLTVQPINTKFANENAGLPFTVSEMDITYLPEKEDSFFILRIIAFIISFTSLILYIRTIKNSFKTLNSLEKNGIWSTATTQFLGRSALSLLIAVILSDIGDYCYKLHSQKTIFIPGFKIIINFEPSISLLLTSLILLLFTWILKFGQQMKLEQDLTI